MAVVSATPEGGEYDSLAQYRFDFCVFGIHTTRKQDDTQSNHTDELRSMRIIELYSQAVATE